MSRFLSTVAIGFIAIFLSSTSSADLIPVSNIVNKLTNSSTLKAQAPTSKAMTPTALKSGIYVLTYADYNNPQFDESHWGENPCPIICGASDSPCVCSPPCPAGSEYIANSYVASISAVRGGTPYTIYQCRQVISELQLQKSGISNSGLDPTAWATGASNVHMTMSPTIAKTLIVPVAIGGSGVYTGGGGNFSISCSVNNGHLIYDSNGQSTGSSSFTYSSTQDTPILRYIRAGDSLSCTGASRNYSDRNAPICSGANFTLSGGQGKAMACCHGIWNCTTGNWDGNTVDSPGVCPSNYTSFGCN